MPVSMVFSNGSGVPGREFANGSRRKGLEQPKAMKAFALPTGDNPANADQARLLDHDLRAPLFNNGSAENGLPKDLADLISAAAKGFHTCA